MAILVQSNKKPSVSFPSQTGSIVTFNSQYAGLPLKSCVVDFEDETGINSLEFSATGKNLCPPVTIGKDYNSNTGKDKTGTGVASSVKFSIDKDKIYVFTKNCDVNFQLLAWDAQDNYVGRTSGSNTSTRVFSKSAFTSGDGTKDFDSIAKIAIKFYQLDNQSIDDVTDAEYQVEVGDTATTYEPFGAAKLFSFGKTIQDGSLNVLTGELTNNDTTPPEVINLGGMEIATLQGENNLFASTGDTTVQNIKIGG